MTNPQTPPLDRTASASAMLRASHAVGSQAGLARLLRVTPPMVYQWCKGDRIVAAEHCPEIERATRALGDPSKLVTCEELRPDVNWGVLRLKAAPTAQERRSRERRAA